MASPAGRPLAAKVSAPPVPLDAVTSRSTTSPTDDDWSPGLSTTGAAGGCTIWTSSPATKPAVADDSSRTRGLPAGNPAGGVADPCPTTDPVGAASRQVRVLGCTATVIASPQVPSLRARTTASTPPCGVGQVGRRRGAVGHPRDVGALAAVLEEPLQGEREVVRRASSLRRRDAAAPALANRSTNWSNARHRDSGIGRLPVARRAHERRDARADPLDDTGTGDLLDVDAWGLASDGHLQCSLFGLFSS